MARLTKKGRKKVVWYSFVILSFFLVVLFYFSPNSGEIIYGQSVYPKIRKIFDFVFIVFDQSLALIIIGLFLFILVNAFLKRGFLAGIKFLFFLFLLFYWLWGFN